MSKKHKKHNVLTNASLAPSDEEAMEYRVIKHDLIKVLVLSLIFLGAILGLFYYNQQSGAVENWFSQLFYF